MNEPSPRDSNGTLALLKGQYSLWRSIRSAYFSHDQFCEFDLIYCVNLDYFEKCLSILGSPFGTSPFVGMLMNPKFHRADMKLGPPSRSDSIYEALFRRILRIGAMKNLTVVDEPFRRYCVRKNHYGAGKIRVIPDVGEISSARSRSASRQVLGIPPSAFVILLYGKLSRRKGLEQLVRALGAGLIGHELVALIAGEADSEAQRILNSALCQELIRTNRLLVRDMFHDDESEALVFVAADVVWLGYTGGAYGSSGVLYQAASVGVPVIAMADGLIGWTVETNEIGITVDPHDTAAVTRVFVQLSTDANLRRRFSENAKRLSARHTGRAFGSAVCDIIESSVHS